jgi:K+-sensing histidine kinase KdpD
MNALDLAVIHDAKNGLGSLLLNLEKRGHFEDEMQLILRISTRLTHLLLWHKEQEGDMHLNVDSASPSDLLKELGAEYQQIFPHLTISVDVSKAPIFWFYDIIYTRLALENAVHNACNFARTRVDLSASMSTNKLMFSVSDDGDGFTQDVLAHLAKQKYTVASDRGTGLGMVLSSAIAQQHVNKGEHGYIQLYNDEGAVFEMLLP